MSTPNPPQADADDQAERAIPDPSYRPDRDAELVLNIMKTDVYPTASPSSVTTRVESDFSKHDSYFALDDLVDAGWVVKRGRGFYDLVDDPRDDVPTWPVSWANRASLPSPLPDEPPNRAVADRVHARYRRTD